MHKMPVRKATLMAFDEMLGAGKGKRCREPYRAVSAWLEGCSTEELQKKRVEAEALQVRLCDF